ncbi:Uncharacterised protein [Mycobacterium tuberculosis]|uniref:Uncharacterized protein n=1 Tax=Mycobacterium tuberculosis TaxID=1773 RepID=A0A655J3H2_MYCTX|nr:Uncharacterised protein [Mycobacterium tuberculosis]COW38890.1 Uncharacterised protein [Mycobacterium tuberculosis]
MDRGVAVKRRHQVLVLADAPHRLGARVVDTHHAGSNHLMQGPPDRRAIRQIGGAGHRPVAGSYVAGQRANRRQHLADGQRAVRAQQGQTHHRGGGNRCGAVDPVLDIQRDPFDLAAGARLVGAHLLQALAKRQRFAEVEIGAAQSLALLSRQPDQKAQVFGSFHRAIGLGGHGFHLVQLVVHDRGRHQIHFGTVDFVDRIGDVTQDPEHRWP